MAPDGSRWLLLIQTHAVVGSRWLPMTPIDLHRVSLLLNHYPKWVFPSGMVRMGVYEGGERVGWAEAEAEEQKEEV